MQQTFIIRTDGNGEIGSGHVMRCSAIAREAAKSGSEVLFATSDESSARLVRGLGFRCEVLPGNYRHLSEDDADALSDLTLRNRAESVLVDSYAVDEDFFSRLKTRDICCSYIDDAYTFELGRCSFPRRWDVAAVVNYGFGALSEDYECAYRGSEVRLCIGPSYAPVRKAFSSIRYKVRSEVRSILLTSGMTNPNRALERMALGCRMAVPDAEIIVVVGKLAVFDDRVAKDVRAIVARDVKNMQEVMERADAAVSAAGTTLYELACVGVPFVAAPVVENQLENASGVKRLGIGRGFSDVGWTEEDVVREVGAVVSSRRERERLSKASQALVDGRGACRIFENLPIR